MPPSELYPKSLLLHFPPQVYQRTSPSDLLPKVLEIVKPEVLKCAQFLQGGKVRLSFKEKSDRDHILYEGLCVDGVDIPVTEHGKKLTTVYLRDLPFEVSSDDLYAFFADYGDATTIERSTSSTCSSLFDRNRVVKIVLDREIPYFLSVLGHDCRAWYRSQTPECSVCREPGHSSRSCPFSGLCLRFRQPGHRAKECGRAWGPALLSSSDASAPVENVVPTSDPVPSDVNSDDSCMSDSTIVPESDPVNIVAASPVDPVPAADLVDKPLVKDKPPVPVPDKVPAADPEKPPDKTSAVATDDDVPMPAPTKPRARSSRAVITAKVFCACLSKSFNPLKFPDINATGTDWDSKAKVHLRFQVKTVFSSRDIAKSNSDLRTWSESDLRDVSTLFCEMLSVRQDYLVDFVFGIVKSYWNNAKKV